LSTTSQLTGGNVTAANDLNAPAPTDLQSPGPTRREFCLHACQTVSLVTVASILEACGGSSPTSPSTNPGGTNPGGLPTLNASVVNGSVTFTVDALSPLAAVGSAALVQSSAGAFLVVHASQNAFTVLTAVCTHQGCTISGFQDQIFMCPCHGSEFSTTGAVVRGPAATPLRQFAAQFSGSTLTFTP
jgi:cytochrome b6-f complex iron-sulfur subunit